MTSNSHCILALDNGTLTCWALRTADGFITSGAQGFKHGPSEGGGMRYLRLRRWLTEVHASAGGIDEIRFKEVGRHAVVNAAHAYGCFLATLNAWCQHHQVLYCSVPVDSIERYATGKGNASNDKVLAAVQGLGYTPADGNEGDALALQHFAVHELKETTT